MSRKWRYALLTCSFLLVFGGLAALFGRYDLAISQRFVNQENAFGKTMEVAGLLVCPWLAVLAGLTLTVFFLRARGARLRFLKAGAGLLFTVGGGLYSVSVYLKTPLPACVTLSVLTLAGAALCVWLLARAPLQRLAPLMRIAAFTAVYIAVSLAAVQALKLCFGRVRFRELADPSQFTPWYLPQGYTGHKSFPSGHTVNASSLYVLTLFASLTERKGARVLCYAVPLVWIPTMAISRVLVGAHYASDVLFGAGISLALFYLLKYLFRRGYGIRWPGDSLSGRKG